MRPDRLRVGETVDEAAELVVRRVPGWAGLAVLTALPLRFLQAHFANRLIELGDRATAHGGYLVALSACLSLALLPALWGRAVLARAAALALAGGESSGRLGREPLRLSWTGFAAYAYAALFAELLLVALGWTLGLLPVLLLLPGVAAATSHLQARPGPWAPLRVVFANLRPPRLLAGLFLVFTAALPIALANVFFTFLLGLWAAGAAAGRDLAWWQAALSPDSRQFVLLAVAGAVLAVEPFWLAALSVAVHRARARQSGEDLAAWFEELRREEAA